MATDSYDVTQNINQISNGSLPTAWTKYSGSYTIPTNANNITVMLGMGNDGTAVADAFWYEVTDVQLEAGPVATPFRRNANSIQGELAACQRYYQRYSGTGSGQVVSNLGTAASTTVFVVPTTIPEMRVSPTSVGISDLVIADGVTTDVVSGVSMASSTPRSLDLRFTSSTLTQYRPGWVRLSSATGYLEISAEL
jgi:hypothetical protein